MVHYILDGYNIIQSGPDVLLASGTLEKKRDFLLELVSGFLKGVKGPVAATVVFDGPESAPYMNGGASASFCRGVNILFSEGRTADERIEELVLGNTKPDELVIVTNDKGIRRRLGGTGARVMEVAEFVKKLLPREERGAVRAGNPAEADAADSINEEFTDLWLKNKGDKTK